MLLKIAIFVKCGVTLHKTKNIFLIYTTLKKMHIKIVTAPTRDIENWTYAS